eukprot:4049801-Pleurochrysis_carterae.AAC.2
MKSLRCRLSSSRESDFVRSTLYIWARKCALRRHEATLYPYHLAAEKQKNRDSSRGPHTVLKGRGAEATIDTTVQRLI